MIKQFILLSLLLLIIGCKHDAEKKPTEESIKLTEVAPNDTQLLGTWLLVQQKVAGVEQKVKDSTVITFDKNNTYKGFNGNTYRFEIKKDTLLLYTAEASKPEKSQLLYVNEAKDRLQLTTKIADGRVVQTRLKREAAN